MVEDLLKRFTSTTIKREVNFQDITLALETNSIALADRLTASSATHAQGSSRKIVTWRVVAETDSLPTAIGNSFTRLNADGLSFVSFGLRGFLAYDRQERTGIAFIPEDVANNESLFRTIFLPCLSSVMKD